MWLYIPSNCAPASGCLEKASEPDWSSWASITEPFATWSGKPLPPPNLSRLWKREPLMRRLSGLTCSPSEASTGAARWIASLPDSLARTSASPAAALGLTGSVPACSSTSSTSPTLAVRGASLWRTSQPSLLPPPPLWTRPKGSLKSARPPESWENWPTAGGTRNGSLFPRPMWAPATGGLDGSASLGEENWPTPVANDDNKTPEAHMAMKSRMKGGPRNTITSLQVKVQTNWLTPHGMGGIDSTGKLGAGGEFAKQATQWLTPNVPNGGGTGCIEGAGQRTSRRCGDDCARQSRPLVEQRDDDGMANASQPRPQGNGSAITQGGGELEPRCTDGRVLPLFAPGPSDPRWAGIIAGWPWLAPATQPGVRMLAHGTSLLVDQSRAHQLRQVGNGCVPLQAAVAFVVLARRAGWGTVK
jgi:hypothetical protein